MGPDYTYNAYAIYPPEGDDPREIDIQDGIGSTVFGKQVING